MASLITHPVVPIALAAALGRRIIPVPLLVLGAIVALLPDLDTVGFRLGIPYASPLGHRGFSHSIVAALIVAGLALPLSGALKAKPLVVFAFLSVSMASHGVLDALTNAGRGVAFFWPFSAERIFFDFRPIEASPISVNRFVSGRGLLILWSEVLWVWLPTIAIAVAIWLCRRWGEESWRS